MRTLIGLGLAALVLGSGGAALAVHPLPDSFSQEVVLEYLRQQKVQETSDLCGFKVIAVTYEDGSRAYFDAQQYKDGGAPWLFLHPGMNGSDRIYLRHEAIKYYTGRTEHSEFLQELKKRCESLKE